MWRWREQKGILVAVIVVQRVRVRWGADARGSTHANLRSTIPYAYVLPQMPVDEGFVVHDILADDAVEYQPTVQTTCGIEAIRAAGLQIEPTDNGVVVKRLPGSDVYPASRRTSRLFTLKPGEAGRYRANFRFRSTSCACAPRWYYEAWTVHVAYAPPRPDLFLTTTADHDVDHRVHLYGGRPRRSTRQSVA